MAKRKVTNNTDVAMLDNMSIYRDYLARLQNIAYSMFEWEGLPDSIPQRQIEKVLHTTGKCLFFDSGSYGLLALDYSGSSLNVYGEPTAYTVVTPVTQSWRRTDDDSVQIFNNRMKLPTLTTLQIYAQKLFEIDRTITTNVKAMKYPILIKGSKEQQMTLENIYMKYDGNEPVIMADSSFASGTMEVLNTEAPYVADKLTMLKHDVWSECLTFLGINSVNTDKKERLVSAEAESNKQHSESNADVMLAERLEACQRINDMFGLNVSVRLRSAEEIQEQTGEDEIDG